MTRFSIDSSLPPYRSTGLRSLDTCKMSTMKFCPKCENILYPKEEEEEGNALLYACQHCEHVEEADDKCLYIKEIRHPVDKVWIQELLEIGLDPILPRTKNTRCAKCGHGEAVFCQGTPTSDDQIVLVFVCCNPCCGHSWQD